jgi:ELWxxDGT repeat protein
MHHRLRLATCLLTLAAAILGFAPARATRTTITQPPGGASLVKDIGVGEHATGGSCGSGPALIATLPNGMALLAMGDVSATGCELWRSDGTPEGTQLVKDVNPGSESSLSIFSGDVLRIGDLVYFPADDGARGREIWVTDGTLAGTRLAAELCPGSCDQSFVGLYSVLGRFVALVRENSAANPYQFFEVNLGARNGARIGPALLSVGLPVLFKDKYYLNCAVDDRANEELCVTDGTDAGTRIFADIRPGSVGGKPRALTPLLNRLVFFADNGATGFEPWSTDGATTALVMDVRPGAASSETQFGFQAQMITRFDGQPLTMLFAANDGTHGAELWRTDGTAAATALVKDWVAGSAGSDPQSVGAVSVSAIYSFDSPTTGREPGMVSLGGSVAISLGDLNPGSAGSSPGFFVTNGSDIYFTAKTAASGREFWRTTLGGATATQVADLAPGAADMAASSAFAMPSFFFIAADIGGLGTELYRSVPGGTTGLVKDINPGAPSASPSRYFIYSDTVFFEATTAATGAELWRSDGTAAGTSPFKNIGADATSGVSKDPWIAGSDGSLWFQGCAAGAAFREDCGLWRSAGVLTNTLLMSKTGWVGFYPRSAAMLNGVLVFGCGGNETEPCRTDGSAGGTTELRDLHPGGDSNVFPIIRVGGAIYMRASAGPNQDVVFRTDGTVSNTVPVSISASLFGAEIGGAYYYYDNGMLMRSSLQLTETAVFKTLPDTNNRDEVLFAPISNGRFFFVIDRDDLNGPHSVDLWFSDGTTEGTRFVRNVGQSESFGARLGLTTLKDTLFFVTDVDGAGRELWRSDGTNAGTARVRDIYPGAGSSNPDDLVAYQGRLFFSATDADGRRLLHVSDGGEVGTRAVRADVDAPFGVHALKATSAGLYFAAADATHGVEPWRSDGTAAGTLLVQDIAPGLDNSNPSNFTLAGRHVFFGAMTPQQGRELWAIAQPVRILLPTIARN